MSAFPVKILIADDEPVLLEIMAKKIAAHGYEVITAKDGEEAWARITNDLPDIIILDLSMSKKDGWEVLSQLRHNPPTKRWQPVIILSGQNELENFKKSVTFEADHYLSKPCAIEEILKAIRLMLSLIPQRNT